jgi:hypothetical protein
MSKDEDKIKHSKRLQKDDNAIKKQIKIAKAHGMPVENAHGFAKHHVMDCGQPGCVVCGNPRHNESVKGDDKLTVQEKRFDKQYKADQKASND